MAKTTVTSKFVNMSAYSIYLTQVKSCVEGVRTIAQGLNYIPPQLGGVFMQQQVLTNDAVIQVIDFKETN